MHRQAPTLIHGLGITNYRSFGNSLSRIGPFGKVNLLIGPNNAGKSNVLSYIRSHYGGILRAVGSKSGYADFTGFDLHGKTTLEPQSLFAFAVNPSEPDYRAWLDNKLDHLLSNEGHRHQIPRLLDASILRRDTDLLWFTFNLASSQPVKVSPILAQELRAELPDVPWQKICQALVGGTPSGAQATVEQVLTALALGPQPARPLRINFVHALRRSRGSDAKKLAGNPVLKAGPVVLSDEQLAGSDLIAILHELQCPDPDQQDRKEAFEAVNHFLRTVLNEDTARLDTPASLSTINVHIRGLTLPLASVGVGIQQLIILALAAVVTESDVLCIEEPELHLHPLLQRALITYLQEETSKQYFITSHSAHLLDLEGVHAFEVRAPGSGGTVVRPVGTGSDRYSVCRKLGYRASDLAQANCVVWVEGPADREYLRWWLAAVAGELEEDRDFGIMYYGGALLRHMKTDEGALGDFVVLSRLCRRFAVIMDSDLNSASEALGGFKERIREEVGMLDSALVWITAGREIENYVDPGELARAVREVHGKSAVRVGDGPYEQWKVKAQGPGGKRGSIKKTRVAERVLAQSEPDLAVLDLSDRLAELADFIRESK